MEVSADVHLMSPREVGRLGEAIACDYLKSLGYAVIDRNWRCQRGELDIVASSRGVLVAVEVKTRRGTGYGAPLEAISYLKARRLRLLLGLWIREHSRGWKRLRIDGIGITLRSGHTPIIAHVEGIV